MGRYSEKRNREVEQIFKTALSSDCTLELEYMKLELLVMADQPCCREYVPAFADHAWSAKAGYFFDDAWMMLGQVAYNHSGNETVPDYIAVGAGLRYYIEQNGLYVGVNATLVHTYRNYNDLMPGIELGYAFFVSRTVTIEPSVYYNQSFKSHTKYSTAGFKIGIGIYI